MIAKRTLVKADGSNIANKYIVPPRLWYDRDRIKDVMVLKGDYAEKYDIKEKYKPLLFDTYLLDPARYIWWYDTKGNEKTEAFRVAFDNIMKNMSDNEKTLLDVTYGEGDGPLYINKILLPLGLLFGQTPKNSFNVKEQSWLYTGPNGTDGIQYSNTTPWQKTTLGEYF